MPSVRKGLRIYVIIISCAGLALLVYWTRSIPLKGEILRGLLFWAVLSVIIESMPVRLSQGEIVTLGFPIAYASLLIYGPGISSWVAICGAIIGVGRSKKLTIDKILFNSAQLTLSISIAWVIYQKLGGTLIITDSTGSFFPLLPSVGAYFLVNTLLVSTAIALQQKTSIFKVESFSFKWGIPNYLAQAPIAFLMAVVYKQISWWASLFLLFPLFIAHYVYRLYGNLRKQHLDTIQALATAIEARDSYTEDHSRRMSEYAFLVAKQLGLSTDEAETIQYAAILHDVGKIGINDKILNKPGALTEEEWAKMKKHTAIGADILTRIDSFREASRIVYYHHERYDGQGYPEKLKGEEIPIGARILSVIDAYDAITSKRPYRSASSAQEAIEEIKKNTGTQFDEKVVKVFFKVLNQNAT
ncbi:MAG: HD-GYP domain-containing protein [Candidatus Aerophobetes bacterium]|nr:HD-GYP domain-containing protein [Candidatus Aerophobetes bacterium]